MDIQEHFINACKKGHFNTAKQLYIDHSNVIDIHYNDEEAFRLSCLYGHIEIAKWLIQLGHEEGRPIDIHARYESAFCFSCGNGNLEVAKWLIQLTFPKVIQRGSTGAPPQYGKDEGYPIDIHAQDEYAFRLSCGNGHLEIVKWLIQLGQDEGNPIDIHAQDDFAFRFSCGNGNLEIVKWLIQLGKEEGQPIDIHAENDLAFRKSCMNGHFEIAKWLICMGVIPYQDN